MSDDLLKTAIELGAVGFRVHPLHMVDGKECRVNGWPEKATTDAHEIVELWQGRDVSAIAIATGDDHTFLDIDEKNGKSGSASLKAAGVKLPKTLTVRTASGGQHLIYRTTGAVRSTVADVIGPDGDKLVGVDVRGRGGFAKVHDAAALIAGVDKIADVPEWLPLAGAPRERAEKPSDFLDRLRKHERRTYGRNALPDPKTKAAIKRARKLAPNIGHADLLDLTERLAELAASGLSGAAHAIGATRELYVRHAPSDGTDWGQRFDDALYGLDKLRLPLDTFAAAEAKPKKSKKKPRALGELMGVEFPPLAWLVDEVIPEGTSLLNAAPKLGKSLMALDIALASATGGNAFGGISTGKRRPVLYVDLESGERRIQARVRAQGWESFGTFRYHLDATTAVAVLKKFMHKHRGKRPLVILDTLAGVLTDRGDKSTQYKHEYESLKQFQALTASDPGSAIIIVHHTRKLDATDPLAMASGTHGITGAVDHVLLLTRPDRMRTDGVLSRISRDVEDAEFELQLVGARWHMRGSNADEARRAHEEREQERRLSKLNPIAHGLLQVIEAAEGATLSIATILDRYDGTSGRDTVTKTLARLAKGGFIEKVGRGAYKALGSPS